MSLHAQPTKLIYPIRELEQENVSLSIDHANISSESLIAEGSTVSFPLPHKPMPSENHDTKESQHTSSEINKGCLLLVEDNLLNQRLTKLIMEKAGFNVITANNGQEAVDLYRSKNEIKLIVMDVHMPILDGLSATQIIRNDESDKKLNRIPIIALTANAIIGDKEKCLEAGCDNYFSKPIMIDVLMNTVKKYILN